MFSRLSVNALLNSVIVIMAAATVVGLAVGAWKSWNPVASAGRIIAGAEPVTPVFPALHNLRVDRASSCRDLAADKVHAGPSQPIREARAGEMPALKAAVAALEGIDFPEQKAVIADLDQRVKKLAALHDESIGAFTKP